MSEFTDFLKYETSASFVDDRIVDFGDAADEFAVAAETTSKIPLLSYGIVSITGSDAKTFVNGQFTTNCAELAPQLGQFSGWCDPQGRVLFLFTLYVDDDQIIAILPRTQISNFIRRLTMYVLRADVRLTDLTESTAIFGVTGNAGMDHLATSQLSRPWASSKDGGSTVVRHGPGKPRFVIVVSDSSAVDKWNVLEMPCAGENVWNALDNFAGLPRIDDLSSGKYLPQYLNLDCLDAVSFSKGCYPGQEIIARLKYRGNVKKRLISATHESTIDIPGGTALTLKEQSKVAGHVLFSTRISESLSVISAVTDIDTTVESLTSDAASDISLQRVELPYAIN